MDYELLIDTDKDEEKLSLIIYQFICEFEKEKITEKEKVTIEKLRHKFLNYDYIYISSTYFSIHIDIDDEDKTDFIKIGKDYGLKISTHLNLELFSKTFNISFQKILKLIGKILKENDKDMMLIDDTGYIIMQRKEKKLIVNNKLDKYKIKYITQENLKFLEYPYIFDKLSGI